MRHDIRKQLYSIKVMTAIKSKLLKSLGKLYDVSFKEKLPLEQLFLNEKCLDAVRS